MEEREKSIGKARGEQREDEEKVISVLHKKPWRCRIVSTHTCQCLAIHTVLVIVNGHGQYMTQTLVYMCPSKTYHLKSIFCIKYPCGLHTAGGLFMEDGSCSPHSLWQKKKYYLITLDLQMNYFKFNLYSFVLLWSVQNPKIFSLLTWKTRKSSIYSHMRS